MLPWPVERDLLPQHVLVQRLLALEAELDRAHLRCSEPPG